MSLVVGFLRETLDARGPLSRILHEGQKKTLATKTQKKKTRHVAWKGAHYELIREGMRVFSSTEEIDMLANDEHVEENFFIYRHRNPTIVRGDINTPKYEATYRICNGTTTVEYRVKIQHLKLAYAKTGKIVGRRCQEVDECGMPYWVDRMHPQKVSLLKKRRNLSKQ